MEQITDERGWVAIKYRNSNGKSVHIKDRGITYSFSTANPSNQVRCAYVAMNWVDPQDVPTIMAVQERICCGKSGQAFSYANGIDVSLWLYGNIHGKEA